MKIWWGFRFAGDCALLYTVFQLFAMYPVYYWRHMKMEPVRWTQRRRTYINNPYFEKQENWKVQYDGKFSPKAINI